MMTRMARVVLLGAAVLSGSSCDDMETPTSPTTTVAVTVQAFNGALSVGGSRFYSFNVSQEGLVSVMLAAVSSPTSGAALDSPLEIGLGVPAGTGCRTNDARLLTAALTSQIQTITPPGTHCVRIADVGHLRATVNFALRFSHP
jgi:hypothetical protein